LRDPVLRRRLEPAEGFFIVEGRYALESLLQSPYPLVSVLVHDGRLHAVADLPLPPDAGRYVASPELLKATAGYAVHRGVLALARRLPEVPALLLLERARARLVVVAEGVSDQENLGSIFRNAAAFGAGAVLLGPTCCDPLYRRTVRVSLGHVLRTPFARLCPWPTALTDLEAAGYQVLALTPRPGAELLSEAAGAVRGAKVAVVVGAEGPGLSEEALDTGRPVRIPMAPGVDSLNVAAATAVALYDLARSGS